MIYVNIIDLVKKEHWEMTDEWHYMSHHCHRGSPIETDWDCGNCDGARCDGCQKVIVPSHLEFSCVCTELEEMLLKKGVPKDVAKGITYDDFYKPSKTGYSLLWPTETMLRELRPDLYEELTRKEES